MRKYYGMTLKQWKALGKIMNPPKHKKGSQALIMSSKHGIGIILPVCVGENESIMNSPFCCNWEKFSNLLRDTEKALIYGEPEQIKKTA